MGVAADHPDAIAYRRTAEAFRAGDFELIERLIAPDVIWHVPGDHGMAGTIWLVEHDVFASDQHVCAISTMGARRNHLDAQTRVVSIFRYSAGRQLERWMYPDDGAAWNAIFSA